MEMDPDNGDVSREQRWIQITEMDPVKKDGSKEQRWIQRTVMDPENNSQLSYDGMYCTVKTSDGIMKSN